MRTLRTKAIAALMATLISSNVGSVVTLAQQGDQGDQNQQGDQNEQGSDAATRIKTTSPIKHVIVIIGENRTFDNLYATYIPKPGQHVANLLSRGIVNADGTPGPQSARAEQFKLSTINPVKYFVDTNTLTGSGKAAYAPHLPTPEAG